MVSSSPIRSNPQCFHTPSESETSHSPTPVQQDSQEAPTSSPGLQRDHPSPALQSALLELPTPLQLKIAKRLDPVSITELRLTCRDFRPVGAEAVEHVTVEEIENLEDAIEAYKEGGLTTLTIKDSRLTDEHLLLLKKLPRLKRLNLVGCHRLTGDGLKYLQHFSMLQRLNLSGCYRLTDAALVYLQHLLALRRLDLSWCGQLTETRVELLRNQLRNRVVIRRNAHSSNPQLPIL